MKDKEWAIKALKEHKAVVVKYDEENSNEIWNDALDCAIEIVEQIEEPKKVVVPEFVGNWFENDKRNMEIYDVFWQIDNCVMVNLDVSAWISENKNDFLRAWLDGYEVEKEKKYNVIFMEEPEFERTTYLAEDRNGILFIESGNTNLLLGVACLTESEIKAVDERFWQFAEPIEEEAE